MGLKARLWALAAGIGAAAAAVIAFFSLPGRGRKTALGAGDAGDAGKVRSDAEARIEGTDARDLVDASGSAGRHHAAVGRIQSEFGDKAAARLRDLLGGAGDQAG